VRAHFRRACDTPEASVTFALAEDALAMALARVAVLFTRGDCAKGRREADVTLALAMARRSVAHAASTAVAPLGMLERVIHLVQARGAAAVLACEAERAYAANRRIAPAVGGAVGWTRNAQLVAALAAKADATHTVANLAAPISGAVVRVIVIAFVVVGALVRWRRWRWRRRRWRWKNCYVAGVAGPPGMAHALAVDAAAAAGAVQRALVDVAGRTPPPALAGANHLKLRGV
jgi:hypothetical protein